MKKIAISDLDGFLGQHLRWFFLPLKEEIEIVPISKEMLQTSSPELQSLIKTSDAVVHLAAAHSRNTPNESDIYSTNLRFAHSLTDACDVVGATPHIIFASSVQIHRDNPYGKSKKDVGEHFRTWSASRGAFATNLIIPHEFGEGGKPFDISFVSTFCHQLARGETSEVSPDAKVSLIYGQDIARAVYEAIQHPVNEDKELLGTEMTVAQIYSIVSEQYAKYSADIVPHLPSALHTALFNTLRYHLWENGFYPRMLQLKSDERGSLFEMVKEHTGGQTFVSTTKPDKTRGNHYHTRKIERFCVLEGTATIRLRKILDDKVFSFEVSGESPQYIDMPTFMTHNISNTGKSDVTTAFWCNEIFDSSDSDTYQLPV